MDNKTLIVLILALFFRKLVFPGAESLECGPPFIPMNGSHTNTKQKYIPGDKIEYTCDKGYHRVGEKQSTCLTNGSWKGQMPFCDPELHLGDPLIEGNPRMLSIAQSVKDKNSTTYVEMKPGDGLRISLKDPAVIQAIRLLLRKGHFSLEIESSFRGVKKSQFLEEGTLAKDDWISFECDQKIFADSICIRGKKYSMYVYEVELYGNDVSSCTLPPPQLYVPNGKFIVNRERAILKCIGSKAKNYTHSVCEDKKWKPIGKPFSCEGHSENTHKNLAIIIGVSVVSVIVILGCLIAILVFIYKKRQPPVLIVMHPKEHYCRGGHSPSAPEEAEYATVIYNDIPLTPGQMRKLPKNIPANLPDLLGYTDPKDEGTLSSSQTKVYVQPQDALPSSDTYYLNTLKKSPFYGE